MPFRFPPIVAAACSGIAIALVISAAISSAAAQDAPGMPEYRDDRSTAEAVIASLYNAISRQEYLRGWSYFRDEPDRPALDVFREGYADTQSVRVRTLAGTSEGAAGSIYHLLPVVIESTGTDGGKAVYAGCYELRQVQPAMQEEPPFIPLGIVRGKLAETDAGFDAAEASCPEEGLE